MGFFASALLLAACGGPDAPRPGADDDSGAPVEDSGTPSGEDSGQDTGPAPTLELSLSLAQANPLAAIATLEASAPCVPRLDARVEGTRVALAEGSATADAEATSHELVLYGLRPGRQHTVHASCGGAQVETTLETLPLLDGTVHGYELTAGTALDGMVALPNGNGPFEEGAPLAFAVDGTGEVRWLYLMDRGQTHADVELERLDDGSLKLMTPVWIRRIDMAGRLISEIRHTELGLPPFHHDALALDDGGWLVLSQEDLVVPSDDGEEVLLRGDRLVRVDAAGTITWTWSSFDHLDTSERTELSEAPLLGTDVIDWTHANAVIEVEELGAWLLSLRNLHRMILIDQTTGEVLWAFGEGQDFTLADGDTWFHGAHAPHWIPGGGLLVYDNDVVRLDAEDGASRVVRYDLDLDARTARVAWSAPLGVFSATQGDVDLLPDGRLLFFTGAIPQPDGSTHAQARIVDGDDRTALWGLDLGDIGYRAEWLPLP